MNIKRAFSLTALVALAALITILRAATPLFAFSAGDNPAKMFKTACNSAAGSAGDKAYCVAESAAISHYASTLKAYCATECAKATDPQSRTARTGNCNKLNDAAGN